MYPLFLFSKGPVSHGYQPVMAYHIAVRLGTRHLPLLIKARRGNPIGGKCSKCRQQSQGQPLLPLLGVPHENQATQLLHMCRRPRSVLCVLSGWWFNLCELLWAQVSWFCGFSCVYDPSGSYNSSSPTPSSARLPQLCLIFICVCICFHQLLGKASLMTVIIGSWQQV